MFQNELKAQNPAQPKPAQAQHKPVQQAAPIRPPATATKAEGRAIGASTAATKTAPGAKTLSPEDQQLLKTLQGQFGAANFQEADLLALLAATEPQQKKPANAAPLVPAQQKPAAAASPAQKPVAPVQQPRQQATQAVAPQPVNAGLSEAELIQQLLLAAQQTPQQQTAALQTLNKPAPAPQALQPASTTPTGTKIPIDEFTRVSVFADVNGKLHLQIDRGAGHPPPAIAPMEADPAAPKPVATEELVIQFGGAKVKVDLDGVMAFAPNSTNITANSTARTEAGTNAHFRDPNEPLIIITPGEFTRNLLVFYGVREKVKEMAAKQAPAVLPPNQFGALASANLFSPTPDQLTALQRLQQQQGGQQQALSLTEAQTQQLARNANDVLSVAPLNVNELRALALVLGHPVNSVQALPRGDLEKLVSKDILLLSSQALRQPSL